MISVVFMLAQEKPTKSAQLLTQAMLTLNTFGPIADFGYTQIFPSDTRYVQYDACLLLSSFVDILRGRNLHVWCECKSVCMADFSCQVHIIHLHTHNLLFIFITPHGQHQQTQQTLKKSERRIAGAELDSQWQSESRILSKLQAIMDNDDSDVLVNRRSTFSQRLIAPKRTTERHRNSFPAGDNQSL